MWSKALIAFMALALAGCGESKQQPSGTVDQSPPRFEKILLHSEFYSEGIAAADFNRDGKLDVVSGPFWYEGPTFSARHELYEPVAFDPLNYSDNFFSFPYDMNGDQNTDVLVVGFPGQDARWYENPGVNDQHWPVHVVFDGVDGESPLFADLTGDGKPELVCMHGGALGWAAPDWSDPQASFTFHALSPAIGFQIFTHGLGVGDIDGDGRLDVIEATAWWQQPASLASDPVWTRHEQSFGPGGAQMFAYDVDADGDADVLSTWEAHEYGVSWFAQDASGAFTEQPILPKDPQDTAMGPIVFEPHALALGDIDHDGLADLVTGRRFWAHVPATPVFDEPSELYWLRLERSATKVKYSPQLIDDASGVGVDVRLRDVDGDGLLDVLSANKRGAFVFLQRR